MKNYFLMCVALGLVGFGAGCQQREVTAPVSVVTPTAQQQSAQPSVQPPVQQPPVQPQAEVSARTIPAEESDNNLQYAEFQIKKGEKVEVDFISGGAGPVSARILLQGLDDLGRGRMYATLWVEWGSVIQRIALHDKQKVQRVGDINNPSDSPLTLKLVSTTADAVTLRVSTVLYSGDGGP